MIFQYFFSPIITSKNFPPSSDERRKSRFFPNARSGPREDVLEFRPSDYTITLYRFSRRKRKSLLKVCSSTVLIAVLRGRYKRRNKNHDSRPRAIPERILLTRLRRENFLKTKYPSSERNVKSIILLFIILYRYRGIRQYTMIISCVRTKIIIILSYTDDRREKRKTIINNRHRGNSPSFSLEIKKKNSILNENYTKIVTKPFL